jgi:hypothetical protein
LTHFQQLQTRGREKNRESVMDFEIEVILKMKAIKRLGLVEVNDWKETKAGEGI